MTPGLYELSYRHSMLIVNLIKAIISGLPERPESYSQMCHHFNTALNCVLGLEHFSIGQVVNAMLQLHFQNGNEVRPETMPQFQFEFVDDVVYSRDKFFSFYVKHINTHPLEPGMDPIEGRAVLVLRYMGQLHEQAEQPGVYQIIRSAVNMALRVFTAFLTLIEQVRQGRNSNELIMIRSKRVSEYDAQLMDSLIPPGSYAENTSEAAEEQSGDDINHHNLLALRTSEVDKSYGSASTAGAPMTPGTLDPRLLAAAHREAEEHLSASALATQERIFTGLNALRRAMAERIQQGFPGMQPTPDTSEITDADFARYRQIISGFVRSDTQSTPAILQTDSGPSTSAMISANPATLGAGAQGDSLTAPAERQPTIGGGTQPASTFPSNPQAPIPAATYQSPMATNQPAIFSQAPTTIPTQPASTIPGYPGAPITRQLAPSVPLPPVNLNQLFAPSSFSLARSTPAGAYQPPVATNQPAFINQVPTNIPPQPKKTPTKAPPTPIASRVRQEGFFRQMSQEDVAMMEEEFQRRGGSVPYSREIEIASARGLSLPDVCSWFFNRKKMEKQKEMEKTKKNPELGKRKK